MTDLRAMEAERLQLLREWSATSARSQQSALGWSETGHDCRRYVWNRLHDVPSPNATHQHVLAALRGTGTHAALEPFLESLGYEVEKAVEYAGIPGHCDAYRDGVVEDTKSALVEKVRALRLYGPSAAWRAQVQGYARALAEKGHEVHTVRIVAYAIDSSDEIAIWQEPYDPESADESVESVILLASRETPPEPGMDASWCEKWCRFFGEGGCPGRDPDSDLVELDDPVVVSAVADLVAARADMDEAKKRKEAAQSVLDGVVGTAHGYAVTQVTRRPSMVPDDDQVRKLWETLNGVLPMKERAGSSYVSVRRQRAK